MEIQPFFDDCYDQIDGNGDANLGLYGVCRGSVKPLDAQVLFDPFEEELHLLSLFVELYNGDSGQDAVVEASKRLAVMIS